MYRYLAATVSQKPPHNKPSDEQGAAPRQGSQPKGGPEFPRSFNPLALARKLEELEKKSSTAVRKLAEKQSDSRSGTGGKSVAPIQSVRDDRFVCSFPGIMKVLVPEKSFLPFPLAVRVANISSGGALVEVHDKTQLDSDIALPNRFFELKVAHPDIPVLRGTIAWSDMSRANPLLGLFSFEQHPELSEIVLTNDSNYRIDGPPPLPTPSINPFPPTIHEETVVISGVAPEALEIIVKRDDLRFEGKISKGQFEVRLEMEPNQENHFTLRAFAGERKSRPVPIRILCEKAIAQSQFKFSATNSSDKAGNHTIKLDFAGTMRQAEHVLYRFSQLMASSERVQFNAVLESATPFDKRQFEALRAEGSLLAADTGRNEAASKLLEELL
jgi:hypothetical protein